MTSSCYCNGITVTVREHQVTALKTASRFLNINDTLIIYSLCIFLGLKNINSIGSVMSHNKSIFYYTDKWIHYHSDCLVPSTFPKHFNSLQPSKRIPCDYWLDLCPQCGLWKINYRKTSNIRRTVVGNKIVDQSDAAGASPVGAAPTTSSFSTWHLAPRDSAKTAARQCGNLLNVGIWCILF